MRPVECSRIVITALLASLIGILLTGCERDSLDRQMAELCAKDGGIKVHETVTLPPEMFDQNGDPFPGWRSRPESQRLGDDYRLLMETVYLKQGDPLKGEGRLDRTEVKVIRIVDNKILAMGVSYGRSGGDFIVVDHFSSSSCPPRLGEPRSVIRSVFLKGGK
jgi:hypothetical protein